MKVPIKLYDKAIDVKAYKIKHVKSTLHALGHRDTPDSTIEDRINIIFETLIPELIHIKSFYDRFYILLILKSKIDDNQLTITHTCEHCNNITESNVNISEFLTLTDTSILFRSSKDLIKLVYDKDPENIVPHHISDTLTIKEVKELEKVIDTILCPLSALAKSNCLICASINTLTLSIDFLFNALLPFDLISLYNAEVAMKLKGYSLKEVANMYPYELEIYSSLYGKFTGANNE